MSLYQKAIKLALYEMDLQITIEGCKKVWTKWQCFQKDKQFIEAKENKKLTLKK